MAFTAQQLCDQARTMLHDNEKVRWPDEWFMAHVVPALDDMRRTRPDLFVAQPQWMIDGVPSIALSTVIPLPSAYLERMSHWLSGLALAREDDNVDEEGKTKMFFELAGRK